VGRDDGEASLSGLFSSCGGVASIRGYLGWKGRGSPGLVCSDTHATAPYLHDHSAATLDDLLNPARLVEGSPLYRKPFTRGPAHPWAVTDPKRRSDLVEFLNSL